MSKCPRTRCALRTRSVRGCLSPSANTCAKGTCAHIERGLSFVQARLCPLSICCTCFACARLGETRKKGRWTATFVTAHRRSWYFVTYGATLLKVSSCAIECRSARKIREFTLWQVSSCAFFFRLLFQKLCQKLCQINSANPTSKPTFLPTSCQFG